MISFIPLRTGLVKLRRTNVKSLSSIFEQIGVSMTFHLTEFSSSHMSLPPRLTGERLVI